MNYEARRNRVTHPQHVTATRYRTPLNLGEFTIQDMEQKGYIAHQIADDFGEDWHEAIAEAEGIHLGTLLDSEREQIDTLDSARKTELLSEFNHPKVSPFIRAIIDSSLERLTQVTDGVSEIDETALFTHTMPEGQFVLPDAQFFNLLQWYSYQQASSHESFEVFEAEAHKVAYQQRVVEVVAEGLLPADTLNRLWHLSDIPVSVSDTINPLVRNLLGWYAPQDGVVVSQRSLDESREQQVLYHEFTHALSAVDLDERGQPTDKCGMRTAFSGELGRIFEEATTEFIAEVLIGESLDYTGAYVQERNLLIALSECSDGAITAQDYTDAYFTPNRSLRPIGAAQTLRNNLNANPVVRRFIQDIETHKECDDAVYGTRSTPANLAALTICVYEHHIVTHSLSAQVRAAYTGQMNRVRKREISTPDFLRADARN